MQTLSPRWNPEVYCLILLRARIMIKNTYFLIARVNL